MKTIVLTAYFDTAPPPFPLLEATYGDEAHHVCFTNRPEIRANGWEVIQLRETFDRLAISSKLAVKYVKFLASGLFPDADWFIWHDYNQSLRIHPQSIINILIREGSDIGVFKHAIRNCAYEEAYTVAGKRESYENVANTVKFLFEEGFPAGFGLVELTCFAYANRPIVNENFYRLYFLTARFTTRDQIIFPYVSWKYNGWRVTYFEGSAQAHSGGGNALFSQNFPPLDVAKRIREVQ